jgi:Flp pilus assembly secretin CpaC
MRRLTLAFCACLSLGATAAGAQTSAASRPTALAVGAGQATQISLAAPVRDIVVGDPAVADVSIVNERTLVVLGKKAGATTLLAFDGRGQPLVDRQLIVSDIPDQAVVVQRGMVTSTYACGERCSKLGGEAPGGQGPAGEATPAK